MKVILLISCILLCSNVLYGQKEYLKEIDSLNRELLNAHDTVRLKILDQLVRKNFSTNRNAEMYHCLDRMQELSNNLGDKKGLFKANFYQGMIAFNIEWQPSKALKHLYRALKIGEKYKINDPKTYSSIYNNLGLIYKNLEQFDSAGYCYQKVIHINENNGLEKNNVVTYLNMARMQHSIGNVSLNLKYARKCLDLALKEGDELSQYIGYKTLAESLTNIRSLHAARNYATKALDLCLKVYGEDHSNMATTVQILFKIEIFSGNYEKALLYAKQAERILVKIYGKIHPKLSGAFLFVGKCHQGLNQYDSAEYYFQRSLKCTKTIQEKSNATRLLSLESLGLCYLSTNNPEQAEDYFNRALQVEGAHAELKSKLYGVIAKYFAETSQLLKSLEYYQLAISAGVNVSNTVTYKDPSVAMLSSTSLGLSLMQEKAGVHEKLYSESGDDEHLIKAAKEYQICDSIINTFRNNYQNTKDILQYNQATVKVYSGGVRVSKRLYDLFGDRKYKEMIFGFAEKAKSNLLYRSISLQNALRYSFLPDSVLNYEETLKGQITYYLSKISANQGNDSIRQNYEEKLFTVERSHERFLKNIEALFPRYYKLKYLNDFLTLQETQKRLGENVIVEYVLTDETIYVILIKNNQSHIIEVEKPDQLDQWVENLRSSILSKEYQQYQDVAHKLYKSLFEPLLSYLEKEDHII
ncbi:tetratricopeptide repeat protein, partial [Fulvivirga kasyanovii]